MRGRAAGAEALQRARWWQLARYVPRVGRWAMLPGAAVVAAGVLLVAAVAGRLESGAAVTDLRVAGVLLAAATGFALDDAAADTVAPSPSTLRWRRGVSFAVVVLVLLVTFGGLLALAHVLLPAGAARECLAVVRWPLVAEFVALALLAVAIAVLAARRLGGLAGGAAAAPGVVLVFVALTGVLDLVPGAPTEPGWTTQHGQLLLLAIVAAVVVVWGLRDPWQRSAASPRGAGPRWRAVAVVVLAAALVAAPLLRPDPVATDERLDAVLADIVAAQGITGLTVAIDGPEVSWARAVEDGHVVALPPDALSRRAELGELSLGEVADTTVVVGGLVNGASSPAELVGWARSVADADGGLLQDRLAASPPPPGSTWRPVDPRLPEVEPTSLTEVRVAGPGRTVVTVLTAGAPLPPCGLSVADALLLALG